MERSPEGDDVTATDAGTLQFDADTLRGEEKNEKGFFHFIVWFQQLKNCIRLKRRPYPFTSTFFVMCGP